MKKIVFNRYDLEWLVRRAASDIDDIYRQRRPRSRSDDNCYGKVFELLQAKMLEVENRMGLHSHRSDPRLINNRRKLLAQHTVCQNCNGAWQTRLSVHHKIPLSKGGTNDIENLEVLCLNCHAERHRVLRGAGGKRKPVYRLTKAELASGLYAPGQEEAA